MKKLVVLLSAMFLFAQVGFAKEVEHKVKRSAHAKAKNPHAAYTLSKFTVCNKTSMPIFFIGWAIDTWDSKPYRWNDWVYSNECRTDKFDKYFNVALYEFSAGPYEPVLADYVLREGRTLNITDRYLKMHARKKAA